MFIILFINVQDKNVYKIKVKWGWFETEPVIVRQPLMYERDRKMRDESGTEPKVRDVWWWWATLFFTSTTRHSEPSTDHRHHQFHVSTVPPSSSPTVLQSSPTTPQSNSSPTITITISQQLLFMLIVTLVWPKSKEKQIYLFFDHLFSFQTCLVSSKKYF